MALVVAERASKNGTLLKLLWGDGRMMDMHTLEKCGPVCIVMEGFIRIFFNLYLYTLSAVQIIFHIFYFMYVIFVLMRIVRLYCFNVVMQITKEVFLILLNVLVLLKDL